MSVFRLILHLENEINNSQCASSKVNKSITCSRFLSALTQLCPSFTKCSSCNQSSDDWEKICIELNKVSLKFWDNWIEDCNKKLEEKLTASFNITDSSKMLTILCVSTYFIYNLPTLYLNYVMSSLPAITSN